MLSGSAWRAVSHHGCFMEQLQCQSQVHILLPSLDIIPIWSCALNSKVRSKSKEKNGPSVTPTRASICFWLIAAPAVIPLDANPENKRKKCCGWLSSDAWCEFAPVWDLQSVQKCSAGNQFCLTEGNQSGYWGVQNVLGWLVLTWLQFVAMCASSLPFACGLFFSPCRCHSQCPHAMWT